MKKFFYMAGICLLMSFSQQAVAQDSNDEEFYYEEVVVPSNIIRVSGGPAWLTSKVETQYGKASKKTGYELSIDYEHVWNTQNSSISGLACGFGINYVYNSSPFRVNNNSWSGTETLKQYYIGPSYAMEWRTSKNWVWNCALGIGYAHYDDEGYKRGGYGFMEKVGCEYMTTEHLGLGVQLSFLSTRFKAPDGFHLQKNETYGYEHISLLAGLRFYF